MARYVLASRSMGIRRTRKEKLTASHHRLKMVGEEVKNSPTIKFEVKKTTEEKVSFYQPDFVLPLREIKKDLSRTMFVTVIAVALQFGLAFYLHNKGGWNSVLSVLNKVSL